MQTRSCFDSSHKVLYSAMHTHWYRISEFDEVRGKTARTTKTISTIYLMPYRFTSDKTKQPPPPSPEKQTKNNNQTNEKHKNNPPPQNTHARTTPTPTQNKQQQQKHEKKRKKLTTHVCRSKWLDLRLSGNKTRGFCSHTIFNYTVCTHGTIKQRQTNKTKKHNLDTN